MKQLFLEKQSDRLASKRKKKKINEKEENGGSERTENEGKGTKGLGRRSIREASIDHR